MESRRRVNIWRGAWMARNSSDREGCSRKMEEIAAGCGHEANRAHFTRMAERLRRTVHAHAEGATLRLGEPMVHDRSSRIWWAALLRALAAVTFGVLTLLWPRHSAIAMTALFGVYAVFDGLAVLLVAANAGRRRLRLTLAALVNIAAGLVALTQPKLIALLLVRVIGGWLILRGLVEVFSDPTAGAAAGEDAPTARQPHRHVQLNAAMSMLFGLGLIAAPRIGALGLMWTLGAWAVLHGLLMTRYAVSLRRRGRTDGSA